MLVLIAGLLLFFVPHILPLLVPAIKTTAIEKLGAGPWKGIYSLLSLAGLVLIVFGWREYRDLAPVIYDPPSWGRHATMLLVWIGFILLSVPRTNPGRILVLVKHPMVVGVFYWSFGHLLANGDLASLLLFGSFLIFVMISRISEFRKGDPRHKFVSHRSDFIAVGAGTVLTALFIFVIHGWITGIPLI